MTTIAVSKDEIAWDSQVTMGNVKATHARDKVVVIDSTVYACCGDSHCCEALPKWHARGAKPSKVPQGDWQMLVITEKGAKMYTDTMVTGTEWPLPAAIGSGGDFATTALKMGRTPTEAVAVSIEIDIFSGPPVKTMKLREVFKTAKLKRAAKLKKKAGSPIKKVGTLTKRKKAT